MASTVETFLRKSLKSAVNASLVCVVVGVILVSVFGWRMPEYIPLFFSRPFGVSQLATFWFVILYPVLLLVFYGLSYFVYKKCVKSVIMAAVFVWMSAVSSFVLLFSLIYVLFLVF